MGKPATPVGKSSARWCEELAARHGIVGSFKGARGEVRITTAETMRKLLGAMDVCAQTEEQARASLTHLEEEDWATALPPVVVLHSPSGGAVRDAATPRPPSMAVPITVLAGTMHIEWRIACENGAQIAGHAALDSQAPVSIRSVDGVAYERHLMGLPDGLPEGYHRLTLGTAEATCDLIVSPGQCWLPPALSEGRRLWGVSTQLYLLRSERDWGIGDYTDLKRLIGLLQPLGADVVGLNPLHAMFPDDPEHASPYSPASRWLLNVLNIDVDAVAELTGAGSMLGAVPEDQIEHCRAARLVEYSAVAALKLAALERIFEHCLAASNASHWKEFDAFRAQGGESLERGCVFFALREHCAKTHGSDWHTWPEELRTPTSQAVQRFAAEHHTRITFHAWLQFLADKQLGDAARSTSGMAIGLYRDLAVGADPSGAETWSDRSAVIEGVQVGAPPDIYNPLGQDWGLPPLNPRALRSQGYRHFIGLLRANMRHAGGLRIDHVMGLQQLYWVPAGASPAEGAYVRYPLEDLLGILALESQRNHCLVVGEDLGTVPEGLRERLAQAAVFSYRVLFFERDARGFVSPGRYPPLALAVVGSHDLPTLRSWWNHSDLRLKEDLRLYPSKAEATRARAGRERDHLDLMAAFRGAGIAEVEPRSAEALFRAAHRFLARTACALAIAQLDDVTDETDPVNVPTTLDEYPNWRRRLSATLEELARGPRLAELARAFGGEGRGQAEPGPAPQLRPR